MATAIPARRIGGANNRRALIIAIVFGLLAALLVYRAVSGGSGSGANGGEVPVLVARQDIPARTVLTDSMLTVSHVPSKVKLATSLTDVKLASGKVARVQIAAGEQVLSSRLVASAKDLDFSGQVPDGFRAVSIEADEVSVTGGLINPGDFVDVVGVFQVNDKGADGIFATKPGGEAGGRVVSATLLQGVQVLAIAQDSALPEDQSNGGKVPAVKTNATARSVTLAVSPDDAARLTLADQMGTLRLALRHVNDATAAPAAQVDNTFPSLFANSGQVQPLPANPPVTSPAAAPAASPTPANP